MTRLRTAIMALVLGLGLSSAAGAETWLNYSPERFAEAQSAGETILVDVTADWCPTCRAQKPILEELAAEEALADVLFVRVDFDSEKDFLEQHRIPRQSTIVVFDGAEEVDRSIAETNRERLRAFVFDAVSR